eukprot:TRINITY_DN15808_c0_g1_i2.p1 TRINITY_DN15808_c0_g1~~TRINITY_DN15808_c0_g1_i2.p1  ORF type:complete len:336 (+),score=55.46 TRINITY_DN15808_c0_g1_i2:132-1139(+)
MGAVQCANHHFVGHCCRKTEQDGFSSVMQFPPKVPDQELLAGMQDLNAVCADDVESIVSDKETAYLIQDLAELDLDFCASSEANGLEQRPPVTLESGATYKGQWKGEMRHGLGAQCWPDGTKYEGEWRDDAITGKGRFLHRNGDCYIGQWRDNLSHGLGIYYKKSRKAYEGQWAKGVQHGHGIENMHDASSRYEGQFRRGQKEGHGVYLWADGSVFSGCFEANDFKGAGMYDGSEGRRFRGQWSCSVMHGVGKYVWEDGRSFSGQYHLDKKQGFGVFDWSGGQKYEGFWLNGRQHGQGKHTKSGKTETVAWSHGERVEQKVVASAFPQLEALIIR